MTDHPAWAPPAGLVEDALQSIAKAALAGPEDRFEAAAWTGLLALEGPQLLTRQAAPSHLTASGLVLSPDVSSTCLVLHRKIAKWVQPGGHLEPGDTTLAGAALREVLEETGLAGRVIGPVLLSRHRAPCAPGRVDWHLDLQHVVMADQVPPTVSGESLDVAWWPVHRLPELRADGLLAWGVDGVLEQALGLLS